ncbi:hypothetical protein PIB30_042017 [Stylosanthes scabra]|uniref:Uncharacterized protein n=1 Tax=Stylosanthes scabra TaxID=79078 RepID=A0ABU6TF91_9FABA|nr:hypothetical protein [Stylosanthes scabra]
MTGPVFRTFRRTHSEREKHSRGASSHRSLQRSVHRLSPLQRPLSRPAVTTQQPPVHARRLPRGALLIGK